MATVRDTSVMITGGAGFIGSHLAALLLEEGRRVTIFDDLSTGSLENIGAFADHPMLTVELGDITERDAIARLAESCGTIVHLAAAVGVELVIEQPVKTIVTNVRGTENILDVAVRSGCRVLLASTSEVYGKGTKFPFSEDDDIVLGPTSKSRWGYAASKMLDEFLAFAYHQEFALDVVPFRLFNTVGARQSGRYGMVIPRLVGQALRNEPLTVYGDGSQQRCFCDVRDVVEALVALIARDDVPATVYNIGGTEEVSILQLAERIKAASNSSSPISFVPYDEAYAPGFEDMHRRIPSTHRIHELLGWRPTRSLDDIIQSVIQHERLNSANHDR